MTELDKRLAEVRAAPPPPGLEAIDASVLEAVHRIRATPLGPAVFGAAAAIALVAGIAGSAFPSAPASASALSPLGGGSPLAPSTLLNPR